MEAQFPVMEPSRLAAILDGSTSHTVLLLDSRTMFEYNDGNIIGSVHMPCSNIMKRRIQTDKVKFLDILHLSSECLPKIRQVVVYDAASISTVCPESYAHIALTKLRNTFPAVYLLKGGYSDFSSSYPHLCVHPESSTADTLLPCISEPTKESLLNCGPTQIFPHLFLGSERDALSWEVMKNKGISHVLNVSSSCPKADFIGDTNFMRIPVNDTYSDKLICHFMKAFAFLDDVKKNNGCALIHCLAGVSRSPTLAIAYVMHSRNISYDEAYRYVKEKRPSISPNLNFLGQLLEFDRTENEQRVHVQPPPTLIEKCGAQSQFLTSPCKRQRVSLLRSSSQNGLSLNLAAAVRVGSAQSPGGYEGVREDLSPSSVISRLSLSSPTQ
ncbi:Dual specificity protein phosphatase 16 [Hypsibius exemplaris]|uniref:protein-tyrosine-phosphatase n=1 Tax=Hypsibius exemplaris TaxID=2072580 RepID=A0A1W0WW20_HYPEX|nr:Dual specificity protein phosphatase 16 [Hypsibius exemplaris]